MPRLPLDRYVIMKWYLLSDRAEDLRPLNFIIGGRGIGKTYGTIDYVLNKKRPFIYLRNTDTQLQECATQFGNPFKRWNTDHERDIRILSQRKHCMIYDCGNEEEKLLIGYAVALSTFENLRGVDLSDVEYVIFDEFCEKKTLSFQQFETFANFYETVNRNREILGDKPLQVFLLSNAQKLDNPILAGYGVIPIIERMIYDNRESYKTDLMYVNLPRSEVSEAKKDTVNYKLTEGTQYYQEALENIFAHDSFAGVKKRPVAEYLPVCRIDDIYIWKHKSNNRYYACRSASNRVPEFSSRDQIGMFLMRYGQQLRLAAQDGKIDYAEYVIKSKLLNILK